MSWSVQSQSCIGGSIVAAMPTKAKASSIATGSLGRRSARSRLQASSAVQASNPVRSRAQTRRSCSRSSAGDATILPRFCVSTCVRPAGSRTVTETIGPGALSRRSASPCTWRSGGTGLPSIATTFAVTGTAGCRPGKVPTSSLPSVVTSKSRLNW